MQTGWSHGVVTPCASCEHSPTRINLEILAPCRAAFQNAPNNDFQLPDVMDKKPLRFNWLGRCYVEPGNPAAAILLEKMSSSFGQVNRISSLLFVPLGQCTVSQQRIPQH